MFGWFKRKPTASPVSRSEPRFKRKYDAAGLGRQTANWPTNGVPLDESIRRDLKVTRARSRLLAMNSDYMKGFLRTVSRNVVGPKGVNIRWKIKTQTGDADPFNDILETEWKRFCKVGVTTVCGGHSFADVERLGVQVLARDGEFIAREIRGFNNGFGYALQLIQADLLDENYNDVLPNGNTVRMGVERNEWLRPVAYYFRKQARDPVMMAYIPGGERERVPAEEIIHIFIPNDVWQTRGMPWAHTAMTRMNMLSKFENSALVNAHVGASKMGFYQAREEIVGDFDGAEKDSTTGEFVDEVEPGQFQVLPYGYEFKEFNPDFPQGDLGPFIKAMLRGAATGLGLDYNSWGNDKEGVNYSTQRSGMVEERDEWEVIQEFFVSRFHARVVPGWLEQSVLNRVLDIPFDRVAHYSAPTFQPRRWSWIDPAKEIKGYSDEVALGTTSRQRVAGMLGRDFREVLEELAEEQRLAEEMGVNLFAPKVNAGPPSEEPEKDTEDDKE